MMMSPTDFFKALADDTRLRTLLLIQAEDELCVCELTAALDESQPKVSRHLAQLRQRGVLRDRRQGQWVYYRINPALPAWASDILASTASHNAQWLKAERKRLHAMGDRPQRQASCC